MGASYVSEGARDGCGIDQIGKDVALGQLNTPKDAEGQ